MGKRYSFTATMNRKMENILSKNHSSLQISQLLATGILLLITIKTIVSDTNSGDGFILQAKAALTPSYQQQQQQQQQDLQSNGNLNNLMKATVSLSGNNNAGKQQQTDIGNPVLLVTNTPAQLPSVQLAASFPQASSREIEKQIVDKILGEGYDKRIRPAGSGPYNASRPGK